MKRKYLVLNEIENLSGNFDRKDIESGEDIGFNAIDIAERLNNTRNNITTDLNALFKEGRVIKIKGKPVNFFSRKRFEEIMEYKLPPGPIECQSLSELVKEEKHDTDDPFTTVIGFDGSLESKIKQAKAAVLYPPNGLHSLITGETGVGKTLFAELMYKYAVREKVFDRNAKFVVFNCADYFNNPQLLMSELFGVVKGAYTGADSDKVGLIEQADRGVLFLDEIHRLPPEGQEMLFTVMDSGTFRRLGEAKNSRMVQTLIIAATTEDPYSALLKTFMRRIPVVIKIPSLSERPLIERFELIKKFFLKEASRVKVPIRINSKYIVLFLCYECPGNIGQLFTDVQLTVARGFLEHISQNTPDINITNDMLPNHIKEASIEFPKRSWANIDFLTEDEYIFSENMDNDQDILDFSQYDLTKRLYNDIVRETAFEEGQNQDQLYEYVRMKIGQLFYDYSNTLYRNFLGDKKRILNYIQEDILDITGEMLSIASEELGMTFENSLFLGLAFHLNNLIVRNEYRTESSRIKIDNLERLYPAEYRAAQKMLKIFCSKYKLSGLPKNEIYFITMLLSSDISKIDEEKRVGILIAAHGKGVASNIAGVVNELLGNKWIEAVDMPLDEKPEEALKRCIQTIKQIDRGSGVLMFVDMGSLSAFENRIKKETGSDVKVIELISTPLIIDAARKALMPGSCLQDVISSISKGLEFQYKALQYSIAPKTADMKESVIITVCLSGQGTAYALEDAIKKMLAIKKIRNVKVIPVSFVSKNQGKEYIERLADENRVIAIAGNINPKISNIPFISIEEIILKQGLDRILYLLGVESGNNDKIPLQSLSTEITWDTTLEAVENHMQFLSARKIKDYIFNFINDIEAQFGFSLEINTKIKIFVHTAYMVERLKFRDNPLPAVNTVYYDAKDMDSINKLNKKLSYLEEVFNMKIPSEEAGYVYEIIKDQGLF